MYRLLIADRDHDTCESLKYMLQWENYNVTCIQIAQSESDFFAKAVDFRPHIALISETLGADFSEDAAEQFRSMGIGTVICIIGQKADYMSVQRALAVGARGYLTRPIDVNALQDFVTRAVLWELHGKLPAQTRTPETDPVCGLPYTRFSNITNKLILMVKADYRSNLTLTGVAESLNMSSKYIGRVFLQETGVKFSWYLTAYRMLRAKRLIESTQDKISVIAASVGYTQVNNFYVHFKAYFNQSPSEIRSYDRSRTPEGMEK